MKLSRATLVCFLALLTLLEVWAIHARDPDFPLLDPFHYLVALLLVLFALTLWVQRQVPRIVLFTLVFALPTLVLLAEWRLATRDADIAADRMAVSSDVLLRYTYRPGAWVHSRVESDAPMTITADGLWDVPHTIPKPPGVVRIVVLGDSVPNEGSLTFEQRFPHRMEQLLVAAAPPGVRPEVVNVSCEGYNTLQEERLLERVGLRYQPDIVVWTYVLNDPFLQNGAYRRVGNSFFLFQVAPLAVLGSGGSYCDGFAFLHADYAFDLVVRQSYERMRMVADRGHFPVLVAPLPIVARFDDPVCLHLYDRVIAVAREQGFATTRVVDAFAGRDYHQYQKPEDPHDVTHPNGAGHQLLAQHLAHAVQQILWPGQN